LEIKPYQKVNKHSKLADPENKRCAPRVSSGVPTEEVQIATAEECRLHHVKMTNTDVVARRKQICDDDFYQRNEVEAGTPAVVATRAAAGTLEYSFAVNRRSAGMI
jgi:hypothetical protein